MQYQTWFQKTVKSITPISEFQLYTRVGIFGIIVFALTYAYTSWLQIPGVLNKSVADVSVILIGLSMLLSGLCYFWNIFDEKIIYRKHLGLIGFAFGVVHVLLSIDALNRLFLVETWQKNAMWPMLAGFIALVIFTIMALISNQYSALHFGGKGWRLLLRTGYLALVLVFAHVYLLKSMRWITWFKEGMNTPPSMSLIVSVFILVVVLMRVMLWFSLTKKKI